MTKNAMTRAAALTIALSYVPMENTAVREVLTRLIDQFTRSHSSSETTQNKRKEATAAARAKLMSEVIPVLEETFKKNHQGITIQELYNQCKDNLPEDFTSAKVQYILTHEMKDRVIKIETKGKPNQYIMKEGE